MTSRRLMPEPPAPPGLEVLCKTPECEARTWVQGPYQCVRLMGKFTEELAVVVRTRVFPRPKSIALDLSALTRIPLNFTREIYFAACERRPKHQRVILIRPPAYLMSILGLISESHEIPTVADFTQLPPDPSELGLEPSQTARGLQDIRAKLTDNPLWQFADRDSCWICPFCALPVQDIRLVSRLNLPQLTVESIYDHVHHQCPAFDPHHHVEKDRETLVRTVTALNADKMASSRKRTEELEQLVTKLEEKSRWADEMDQGLQLAADRQKHLLPSEPPQIPQTDIALVYRSASRISGDFYDFFPLPDGRFAVIIGDVSGHGIEAGILMGMTKKVLQIRVSEIPDLRQAVLRANDDIHREMGRQSFVTALVALLDPARRTLTYVRAGHTPILLINPARTPDLLELDPPGTLLGMSPSSDIETAMKVEETLLLSGDLLLLYTDGLEEAVNREGTQYGRTRVREILSTHYAKPARAVLEAITSDVSGFVGTPKAQHDDLTMIGLRIL